jgi:hypothetical protein
MKKLLFIFIALAILIPLTVYAFSFSDVVNFGKSLIHKEVKPTPEEVKNGLTDQAANLYSYSAQTKYLNWKKAYEKKDITLVISDSRNLYFTDTEINYLIAQELAAAANPPARDINVSFSENLVKVSGIAMLKNFSGQFNLEGKIVKNNNDKKITLAVTRARYKNLYFPSFLAQMLMRNQLQKAADFLYSNADYQDLSLTIGNGFAELNYGK